jgi:AcrR family transcriptional regulator
MLYRVRSTDDDTSRRPGARPPARRRVAPLSPDERRAAIVEATLPLLCEHGSSVSTRQIAEAAGIAEGTIFRVFPDKQALLVATTIRGIRPDSDRPMLSSVDLNGDLRARLTQVVRLLADSMAARGRLMFVIRELLSDPDAAQQIAPQIDDNRKKTMAALEELLEPYRDRLRISIPHASRIILNMIFSASGMFDNSEALSSEEVVAVLLDGLLIPQASSTTTN